MFRVARLCVRACVSPSTRIAYFVRQFVNTYFINDFGEFR